MAAQTNTAVSSWATWAMRLLARERACDARGAAARRILIPARWAFWTAQLALCEDGQESSVAFATAQIRWAVFATRLSRVLSLERECISREAGARRIDPLERWATWAVHLEALNDPTASTVGGRATFPTASTVGRATFATRLLSFERACDAWEAAAQRI